MNLTLSIIDYFRSFSLIYIGLNIHPEFGVSGLNVMDGTEVSELLWQNFACHPQNHSCGAGLGNLEKESFFGGDWKSRFWSCQSKLSSIQS